MRTFKQFCESLEEDAIGGATNTSSGGFISGTGVSAAPSNPNASPNFAEPPGPVRKPIFRRKPINQQEEVKEPTGKLKDACWKGYTASGFKKKNGKRVPNCVPKR